MPEKSNKAALKSKNDNSSEKIIHLTKNELENLVESTIKKASKPLEAEIKELKTKLNELVEGQNFISHKHEKKANGALTKHKKQKEEINMLNNHIDELQKKSDSEELQLDELKQYDRRQNFDFVEVP